MRTRTFVVATFSEAGDLLRAVYAVRAENFRVFDVHAPCPLHDLDRAMGIRRSRLPLMTLVVAGAALVSAVVFEFYAAVFDWPLNVGGKPANSTLAFIPIAFELTVLGSALLTVAALFLRARLFPGRRERVAAEGVTDDTFALLLRKRESLDVARARVILAACGAGKIEEREMEL